MTNRMLEFWNDSDLDVSEDFLEHAPVMMQSTDATGCIEYVSNQWAQFLGFERHELVGRRIPDMMTEESKFRALTREIPRFLRTGRAQNVEYDLLHKDGTICPILLSSVARYDDDGRFLRSLAVICDNSANKFLETIERKVELAERENSAKTRFLANMSHELRTPLNAIIGFAQLISGKAGPITQDKQIEYGQHIMESGDRLLKLINQVLDLSSIEAGSETIEIEEVDIRQPITTVMNELGVLAAPRNVSLINQIKGQRIPLALADEKRLTQAIVNLVANAIKYNRRNGTVTVSVVVEPATLRICVEDTGPGIPADRHAEVFETFNRLGAESSRLEGSGIGLSLAKEYTEKMGGSIGFSSEVGIGSMFWLELPLAAVDKNAIADMRWQDRVRAEFPAAGSVHRRRDDLAS